MIRLIWAAVSTMLLAACTGAPPPGPPPAPMAAGPAGTTGTPIRLRIDDTVIPARLNDTATARDLLGRLPLSLTFRDLNGLEKTAPLPSPLSTVGAPDGDSGRPLDLGYYSPAGDLVLYYGDVLYYRGIVRIGTYDADPALVRNQPDGVRIAIDPAS